jgi:recombination protein RecA
MFSVRPVENTPFALKNIPKTWVGALAGAQGAARERTLPLRFGDLDDVLPGGGLPRGAVVELATPSGLACATSIALAACASAQAQAKLRGGEHAAGAWCAWVEASSSETVPTPSLFAPAVERTGIDLARFLVAVPPLNGVSRVAVRMAASCVFSVLVIDLAGIPGQNVDRKPPADLERWVTPVRRLAITVEELETTVMLLTDARAKRSLPLPTALRLEIERAAPDHLRVTIAKERYGRVAPPRLVALPGVRVTSPYPLVIAPSPASPAFPLLPEEGPPLATTTAPVHRLRP